MDGAVAAQLPLLRTALDDLERQRAERFHFRRDHDMYIAAHALARSILSEATGVPAASLRFVNGPYGKPALAPDAGNHQMHFNISHTDGLVACAVSDGHPLGVDVESCERQTDLDIAHRYFAPEESALVLSAAPDQGRRLFFRFWTLKEAFIKATGEGLSRPLESFAFTLDPIRITFHDDRHPTGEVGRPEHWQFAQCCPIPNRFLALAVRRPGIADVPLDIQAADLDEIVRRL
jgi:4'-phosphopantetheinyl transferase